MARPEEKPKRIFMPKVKTGCKGCKIRKIKCDETKPFCNRCTSTGRKCDGYQPQPQRTEYSQDIGGFQICWSISERFGSSPEQRSFQHFHARTSSDLSGFFDATFWSKEVLQAAVHEPAIRHLVIALGAAHEQYITRRIGSLSSDSAERTTQFVLQQCNRSIQYLVKLAEPRQVGQRSASAKMCILTAATLFSSICHLEGNQLEAISHLRGALKVLYELDSSQPKAESTQIIYPVSINHLRSILCSLNIQARAHMSQDALLTWPNHPQMSAVDARSPPRFLTFADAHIYIEALYINILTLLQKSEMPYHLRPVDDELKREHGILSTSLAKSEETLNALVSQVERVMNEQDEMAVKCIRLYQTLLYVWLQVDFLQPSKRESVFDALAAEMQKIVDLCSDILERGPAGTHSRFSPGLGVIMPLHMVAARCRDPILRRRAVNLLTKYPRREGLWEGYVVAKIATQRIELEEELSLSETMTEVRSAEDVPEDARVREVQFTLLSSHRAALHFITVGNWKRKERGFTRDIAW